MELLRRLRIGEMTEEDKELLNSRVIHSLSQVPGATPIACHKNSTRSQYNNSIFYHHLKRTHSTEEHYDPPADTLVIKASNLRWTHNKKQLKDESEAIFYNRCADYHVKNSKKKFIDPLLKLYNGIEIMLTNNDDVANGIANGTICKVKKIVLKEENADKILKKRMDGYYVNVIDAHFVKYIQVQLPGYNGKTHDIYPDSNTADCQFPMTLFPGISKECREKVKISMTQFPVLVNHATTVHKLQGQSKDRLFVSEWSYKQNWVYVALSRVRTLQGLYFLKPIDWYKDFSPNPKLTTMIKYLRTKTPNE